MKYFQMSGCTIAVKLFILVIKGLVNTVQLTVNFKSDAKNS